jgi:hypothetical protein
LRGQLSGPSQTLVLLLVLVLLLSFSFFLRSLYRRLNQLACLVSSFFDCLLFLFDAVSFSSRFLLFNLPREAFLLADEATANSRSIFSDVFADFVDFARIPNTRAPFLHEPAYFQVPVVLLGRGISHVLSPFRSSTGHFGFEK